MNGTTDAQVIAAMYADSQREVAQLRLDLATTRQHLINREHEIRELRKEVQRLRMECDTDIIHRGPQG